MFDRRLIRIFPIPLLMSAILLSGGCGGQSDEGDAVLAEIGDRTVTADYYQQRLARMQEDQLPFDENGQRLDMSTLEGKRQFLEVIIDKELMVAKAIQLGYREDSAVQQGLRQLNEYHGMIFFWQDEIGDPSRLVSEADLDHYYSRLGENRHCLYVITNTLEQARQARQAALDDMPWHEIGERFHYNRTQDVDRLQVTVTWGAFRDDFQRPVYAVDKGEITDIIETEYGYWVMKVNDITYEQKPELDDIKGEVLASIAKRKEQLYRDELVAKIRQERNFSLDEDVLQIVYDGLPEGEVLIDQQTGQPTPREELRPLDVPTSDFGKVLLAYDMSDGRVEMTLADIKTQFDRQGIFDRPRKSEGLGALRTKLRSNAERSMMMDEATQRGYMQDERVTQASFTRIEEMLVDRVHKDVVSYDEHVSLESLQEFWDEHAQDYHRPERRSGTMVHCADQAKAQAARQALVDETMTWHQAIRAYNRDPHLTRALGRVMQIRKDDEGPVRDQLFSLEVGEISEPFAVEGGWAVIQLDRIHAEESPALSEVTEMVGQRIKNRRMDVALRRLLNQWREEFGVTIYEDRLADLPSWEEAVQAASMAQMSGASS